MTGYKYKNKQVHKSGVLLRTIRRVPREDFLCKRRKVSRTVIPCLVNWVGRFEQTISGHQVINLKHRTLEEEGNWKIYLVHTETFWHNNFCLMVAKLIMCRCWNSELIEKTKWGLAMKRKSFYFFLICRCSLVWLNYIILGLQKTKLTFNYSIKSILEILELLIGPQVHKLN